MALSGRTLCSPVGASWRFERTFCFFLQDGTVRCLEAEHEIYTTRRHNCRHLNYVYVVSYLERVRWVCFEFHCDGNLFDRRGVEFLACNQYQMYSLPDKPDGYFFSYLKVQKNFENVAVASEKLSRCLIKNHFKTSNVGACRCSVTYSWPPWGRMVSSKPHPLYSGRNSPP
jgi:hypothetical protein